MAATMRINRRIGAAGAPTNINVSAAGVKLTVDDSNVGTTPLDIPASGAVVNCSIPASLALECTAATGSVISNKRFSFNGVMPTGFGFFMNTEGTASNPTSTTYAQVVAAPAGATTTISASSLGTANYVWMGGGVANTTTQYDSTSGAVIAAGIVGKWCKVLVAIASTATDVGSVTVPSLVLSYDEA